MSDNVEPQPEVGDRVVAADDLAIGDLVWFDTSQPGLVLIRKVLTAALRQTTGRVYGVGPGDAPGSCAFAPIGTDA